jgi:hypothetical protein
MAPYVRYEHVEFAIDAIRVTDDVATVHVRGTIDVVLQHASNVDAVTDRAFLSSTSVPFEGDLEIAITSQTVTTADLRVDLSDWCDQVDNDN